MKILFVRVSAIGDVIHTLPALFLIKKLYPESSISWLVQKKAASLLVNQPFLDKSWVLPDHYLLPKNLPTTIKILNEARAEQWDAIIDFQGIFKTTALLWFLRGKKYGFDSKNTREGFTSWFTHKHDSPTYKNIIQKNLSLVSSMLWDMKKIPTSPSIATLQPSFFLSVPEKSKHEVDTWLEKNNIKNYIILAPNTTWDSKLWPEKYWCELFNFFHQQKQDLAWPYDVVLLGKDFGNPAALFATYIQEQKLTIHLAPRWDLVTTTHLLSRALLVVGPDTGIIHLADFLGTHSISIFGPTNKDKHGPFLTHQNCLNAIQIECPHYYEKTHGKNQKTGTTQNCMYKLSPTMLHQKIETCLTHTMPERIASHHPNP